VSLRPWGAHFTFSKLFSCQEPRGDRQTDGRTDGNARYPDNRTAA